MASNNFFSCIGFVLRQEGGLVTLPGDSGGQTNFGISSAAYPNLAVAELTAYDAMDIYHRDYWVMISGDELPLGLDLAMLDFAVNSGVETAAKRLQGLIGVEQDGDIGQVTLAAVKAKGAASALITALTYSRQDFIRLLGSPYETGLLARTERCSIVALAMVAAG